VKRRSLRLVVPALLALVSIAWLHGSAADVHDPGFVSSSTTILSFPQDVVQNARPASTTATTIPVSTTLFFPLVPNEYWTPPDSTIGVQIFGNIPEAEAKLIPMGAKWVRFPFNWSSIEPTNTVPADYHWPASLDQQLARLSANDVQVILTLSGNPSWAAEYPGGPIDRVDVSELAEFMAAVVNRYRAPPYNVKYWEFYNEPDNGNELLASWGASYWGNDGPKYAQMLAAVRGPIKAADPEAQIVFGGLAYDNWSSENEENPFVEEFLDDVLATPGGDSFDVMNFHYYPAFRNKWEPYGPDIIGKATYLRNKLASYELERPLICTEASQWSDDYAGHGGSDELQSRYVAQVFARSMAADLGITIWYRLIDQSPDAGGYYYGLLNSDLTPKPSYQAYRTYAQQMGHAEYVRSLDAGDTGSDRIEAYEFSRGQPPTTIIVAWTTDEQEHDVTLQADQVLVVDKFGAQITLRDGDDGSVDGTVRVTVGPSPVYLHFQRG
jgi:hypothetical protein